jgi:RNA-dependent RNA polymerase
MDFEIRYLPEDVNEWDVTRAIASIVHSDEFAPRRQDPYAVDRAINFRVKLNPSKAGGVRNDGSGRLTLPTADAGNKLAKWLKLSPLKIKGKKLKLIRLGHPKESGLAVTLDKTPFINPDLEEEHQKKLWDLQDSFRVDAVQFGFFYRPNYPSKDSEPLVPRAFSIEWEHDLTESTGWLSFEYDHKLIRLKVSSILDIPSSD